MADDISRNLDSVVALNSKITKVDLRGFKITNHLLTPDHKVDELCIWLASNRPGQWMLKRHFVSAMFNNERRFNDNSLEVKQLTGWINKSRKRLEPDGIYIQVKRGLVRPTFNDDDLSRNVLSPTLRRHAGSGRKIVSIVGNIDASKLKDPDNIKIVTGTKKMLRAVGSSMKLLTSNLDEQRRVLKEKAEAFEADNDKTKK